MFFYLLPSSSLLLSVFFENFISTWTMFAFVPCYFLSSFALFGIFYFFLTNLANSYSLPVWFVIVKFIRKLMPTFAMCFIGKLSGWTIAPENIFSKRNKLKVIWVTTFTVFTKMVNLWYVFPFASFKFTNLPGIKYPVGRFLVFSKHNSPISAPVHVTIPIPTSSLVINRYLRYEASFFYWCRLYYQKFIIHIISLSQMSLERN